MSHRVEHNEPESDPTPQALRRLVLVLESVIAFALLSYLIPGTTRVRPWQAGEGVPIARMFHLAATAVPGFAEAAANTSADVSKERVAGDLGKEVAANLDATGTAKGAPKAAASRPGAVDAGADGAKLRIDPSEYEGISEDIEHAEALAAFFAKLKRTAAREPGAIARVAHYGDSAVAADAITSTARRRLQDRFGDAGHGFVLMAHGDMHYVHKDVVSRNAGQWDVYSIVENPIRPGFYGYGGVQTRAYDGSLATVGTTKEGDYGRAVSRFELFYQRYPGGGLLELKIDGKRQRSVRTNAEQVEDGWELFELADGSHSFGVRSVGAPTRVFGVTLERSSPGIVYDSLGLVGARAERLLNAEPKHMRAQIAHRDADLLVLAFGGNETDNPWLNLEQYEKRLTQVVQLMRSGKPEMSCLLLGPLDQGERNQRGQIATIKWVPKIVEIQRKVSAEQQCAFFDVFQAMGGEGAMSAWVKSHPKLAGSDLHHATPAGYEVIGNMYYKALLKAFNAYLAARGSS